MREISRPQAIHAVKDWVESRTPAALVRFGEGEGRLLYATDPDPQYMRMAQRKLRRQAGYLFSTGATLSIRDDLLYALDNADIVALKGAANFPDENRMWHDKIEAFYAARSSTQPDQYVTHAKINADLFDALPDILKPAKAVSLVTCRDVKQLFEESYGLKDVALYPVPSHHLRRKDDTPYETALHETKIYPDFIDALKSKIRVREKGEIFLIGAGLFAKGLCIELRKAGAIAIDFGSGFDRLVGMKTVPDWMNET